MYCEKLKFAIRYVAFIIGSVVSMSSPCIAQASLGNDIPRNTIQTKNEDETSKESDKNLQEVSNMGEGESINWDSYLDSSSSEHIANSITKGVRVEDIVEPPTQYRYAAFGKSDPFVPPMLNRRNLPSSSLEIPIVSVLQRYRIDSLVVVGLWELSTGERKALIMTPKEEGIIVKVGDPIGNKGGKVFNIEDTFLKVREFTLAPDGTRQFEDSLMYLGNEHPDEKQAILMEAIGAETNSDEAIDQDNTGSGFLETETSVLMRKKASTAKKNMQLDSNDLKPYDPAKELEKAINSPAADIQSEEVKIDNGQSQTAPLSNVAAKQSDPVVSDKNIDKAKAESGKSAH
ncbi:MAG: pilus assembly protein PilP [Bdellovibrionota bacterium]